jgi:endoribonuclease Dicer
VADEIRQYVTWYEAQDDRHEIAPHELEREGPKLLGDIFESLCGAIFVDLGYNVEEMWGIVAPMVAPFIDEHCISESVNKHPIRRFHEKCRKLGVSHEEILFK